MKVMVTGGTGFVGSHTTAELVRAGHAVKLLVRNADRVRTAFEPLGLADLDLVTGDVTDRESVSLAMEDCDAVLHAASIYSMDPRAADSIRQTNVAGAELVIGLAHERRLDPIVHVSSFVALAGEKGKVLGPDSAPTVPKGIYARSKADSDRVARRYQQDGAPVVITYPGAVWGPDDPHMGESCQNARAILRRFWTTVPVGGFPVSDVRDVARLHSAVIDTGRGPRRYMSPSRNTSIRDLVKTASAQTGRWLPCVTLPGWTLTSSMRVVDAVQLLAPFRMPFNFQSAYIGALNQKIDDALTRNEFDIEPVPLDQTVADTIRSMCARGQLSRGLAGRLAA